MRQNPHVRICGGPGSATTLVYPTAVWCRIMDLDRALPDVAKTAGLSPPPPDH